MLDRFMENSTPMKRNHRFLMTKGALFDDKRSSRLNCSNLPAQLFKLSALREALRQLSNGPNSDKCISPTQISDFPNSDNKCIPKFR